MKGDGLKKSADLPSGHSEIDTFIQKVKLSRPVQSAGKGRLIFALDATASRQPTWDMAARLQGEMFEAAAALGQLQIQLCFYRGFNECKNSKWLTSADELHRAMSKVRCAAGRTQIERVLGHALSEHKRTPVNALVFVGDCMEEEIDRLASQAATMGLRGIPLFIFQEGYEPLASTGFAELARLSKGAHCRFDSQSAEQLKALLIAVAAYAAGGMVMLEKLAKRSPLIGQIKDQLPGPMSGTGE